MSAIKEAITFVCNNINSGLYIWDEKKAKSGEGWIRFGIKVHGDRQLIDIGSLDP
jgi:hypothetical protein